MESLKKTFIENYKLKKQDDRLFHQFYQTLCEDKIKNNKNFHGLLKEKLNNGKENFAIIGDWQENYKKGVVQNREPTFTSELDDDIMKNPKLKNKDEPDEFKLITHRCQKFTELLNNEKIGYNFSCTFAEHNTKKVYLIASNRRL